MNTKHPYGTFMNTKVQCLLSHKLPRLTTLKTKFENWNILKFVGGIFPSKRENCKEQPTSALQYSHPCEILSRKLHKSIFIYK